MSGIASNGSLVPNDLTTTANYRERRVYHGRSNLKAGQPPAMEPPGSPELSLGAFLYLPGHHWSALVYSLSAYNIVLLQLYLEFYVRSFQLDRPDQLY